jgi:energy-coupling factor transporter ATP-binding protein EcfA2
VIASLGPRQMPYPGLRPFEAEDAPLFFGREAQVNALLRQLEDHRLVAVVGSSGSGKSSLVRAGLLPAVGEGFLLGTTDWRVLLMRPGQYPYQGLARVLSEDTRSHGDTPVAPVGEASATAGETRTVAALRSTDRGLLLALADTSIGPDCRVMVVVDQFEELFGFRRTAAKREEVISRDEAAGFVRLLLRSCSDPEGRVWVVLTMRSDFIGDCEAFLGLPEAVSRSQFLVPRLDRSQMEAWRSKRRGLPTFHLRGRLGQLHYQRCW